MFYIRFSFIFILLLSGACGKKDDNSVNTHLYGAWDSYKAILPNNTINGPAPWILCCYEQGFELFADGKYSSRYLNNSLPDSTLFQSSVDPRFQGLWSLNKEVISFHHTSDLSSSTIQFKIAIRTDKEIILTGLVGGYPIYYLRKN